MSVPDVRLLILQGVRNPLEGQSNTSIRRVAVYVVVERHNDAAAGNSIVKSRQPTARGS